MAEFSEEEEDTVRYSCSEITDVPQEVKEAVAYFCSKMVEINKEPKGNVGHHYSYTIPKDTKEVGKGSSDMPEPSTSRSQENPRMKRRKTTCEAEEGETDELLKPAKKIMSFIKQNSKRRKAGKKSTVLIFCDRSYKIRDENQPNEDEQSHKESPTSGDSESPSEDQDLSHL
ncbi:uncharacterized protein LOC116465302 [Hylobates moloch]|uniref:uncharacterized protein LOC116465302 n=1 Tax=Hylobates moloch TaxID=81572 RepID=UPI0013645CBD|nr:uncharacterized protein LOC116465302 [Hylobates moloch]